jgi:iron-sulfur cluster assembly accessory protein
MVMVTKTSSAELATEGKALEPSGGLINNDYTILSGDLIITSSCLARVDKLVQLRKSKGVEEPFLRLFVDAGGCSGFQYRFEIDEGFNPEEDITLVATATDGKPRIVVDETSLGFLKGSTIDYIQELAKAAFVVTDNPQSESACGCGSSFAVKNFSANPALD